MRVGLFVTCLVDMMRPSIGFAALKLLERAGCEVVVPSTQTCCGQPGYNSGDRKSAGALARKVLAEFGTALPEGIAIRVHDSTADMRYMVLPLRPAGTDGCTEERLAALVTRDSLIGVGLAGAATDETIAS